MARRSLKPQLNQIRAWVRQGRTDAWIAHQLEISASELREFRKQHDLNPDAEDTGGGEVDLPRRDRGRGRGCDGRRGRRGGGGGGRGTSRDEADEDGDEEEEAPARKERKPAGEGDGDETGARPRRRRRRGRRGGRGRRKEARGDFDHGERDGYGLWLDAAVKDNPVYAEHWAGKSEVTVRIDADQIVIRRAGESAPGDEDGDPDE